MSQFISAQDRQKKGHAHLIKKKNLYFQNNSENIENISFMAMNS